MDRATLIATALASGAANERRPAPDPEIAAAYAELERLIRWRFPDVDLASLRESEVARVEIAAELRRAGADADPILVRIAERIVLAADTPMRLEQLLRDEASGRIERRRRSRRGAVPAPPVGPGDGFHKIRPLPMPEPPEPGFGVSRLPRVVALGGALVLAAGGVFALLRWLLGGVLDGPPIVADDVDVTIFSPPQACPGESLMVQVFAHLPAESGAARSLAGEFDPDATRRGVTSLGLGVVRGSRLGFELSIPGAEVDPRWQTIVWRGRTAAVQFAVDIPADMQPRRLIGSLRVSLDSVPVGDVKFTLAIDAGPAPAGAGELVPAGEDARPYDSAFVSYAREDRAEVLRRVQMLRLAHIRCFQDVLDLDPGERWERRLYREIDRSDVVLLFWSAAARDSEWVRREVQYALAREGGAPEILPVIIEVPPCAPWPELADQQFDDTIARLIVAAD